ncbi:serine/threonine-protein phosphatase 2A activator-like [Argopecten irradians]|uniref:serine/threonine-protein phosphatase 2A activator-like n=1 Tax=Argopecten irradians TaxID=31199 RepID=UPI00371EEAC1
MADSGSPTDEAPVQKVEEKEPPKPEQQTDGFDIKSHTDIHHLNNNCCRTITKLVNLLDNMSQWIDEIPPIDQPQRFGNKAFKEFYDRLKDRSEQLLKDVLDEKFHAAVPEIAVYLQEGIGNSTRIDYGTGHELAFVAFLCCLFKIGALTEDDAVASALQVFQRYLVLVRKLQQTYRMEPAGSQGVWSLDDHQFIPFIWGSSQLLGHKRILPKSFVNPDIYENFDKDYMFLGCIKYIDTVKTGPFAEHSNQLWNISGVKEWQKVNSGLVKMYKAEVLAKFPVVQHFLFGSLLPFVPANVT